MRFLSFSALVLSFLVSGAMVSAETIRVRPDGEIRFDYSVEGPTRLSVKGDRISKIIQADSQFEMVNDENTGDVFLRFGVGEPQNETGHIITEAGHTIGFTMRPNTRIQTQTILIELTGVPSAQAAVETSAASVEEAGGFAVNEGGTSSHSGALVDFVRKAIAAKIGTRSAGSHRQNQTYVSGAYRARILSVPSGSNRPQSYYSSRVVAVWVDDVSSGGRRWVVIVENK